MSDQAIVAPAKTRPSIIVGLGGVVLMFAGTLLWVCLGGRILHLNSFYASFVFAWYWGIVGKAEFIQLPSSILGALLGVAVAWQLSYLSAHYGNSGLVVAIFVIAVVLFMQNMHWGTFLVNPGAMLFLAVFTAPNLLGKIDYVDAALTIVAGAIYMAVVVFILKRMTGMGANNKTS